ncbi:MAG: 2OG-Fe(II) oxygenase [Deltaproteobacteria bacterium]|nr:2OG-Fe(II) oxygenase [Deltaproteobacteria bacterium]
MTGMAQVSSPAGTTVDPRVAAAAGELAARFRAAAPFPHVVIDGFLAPALCRQLVETFPAYDGERFRNDWGELGKAWREDVSRLGPAWAELDRGLRSPEFLGLLSRISGIPHLLFDPAYFGGGTHENLHDMELDPHVDFNLHPQSQLHRRLNLLLYLNDEWDEAWGGALELHTNPWRPPHENRITTIPPLANRCVIFETSDRSWHGFRRIALPENRRHLSRRSFAMYLYTRERPALPLIPHDVTIYTDRPLPDRIHAGYTLTEADVAELGALVSRRDRKLEYLYGRAIDYAQPTLAARVRRADRWAHLRGLPGRALRKAGRLARRLLAGSSPAKP